MTLRRYNEKLFGGLIIVSLACVFVFRFIAKSAGMEVRVGMARVNGNEWRVLLSFGVDWTL